MTTVRDTQFEMPTDAEIRRLVAGANRMRAQVLRAGLVSFWTWLRGASRAHHTADLAKA